MLQITSSIALNLFLENLLFVVTATAFLLLLGWIWRNSKPFTLFQPLPQWISGWIVIVQIVGIALPLIALFIWGSEPSVAQALIPYFVILGAQIATEIATLKHYQSCVWVMVPYLYLPYRIWQLYTGLILIGDESEFVWVQRLLIVEIVLWILNYLFDVSQLPKLFKWEMGNGE